jgi:hypothetical protein
MAFTGPKENLAFGSLLAEIPERQYLGLEMV